jgi:Lrp/AsnC family transcriptional regulator for asnA, asnC and gidA
MDDLDQRILSYLIGNARVSFSEVARECGISAAAAYQRVKKMEEAGIIIGSRFIVQPEMLGYGICAFVGVRLSSASPYDAAVTSLTRIPEVVECHFVTGEYALLLKIYCRDNRHLLSIIAEKIHKISGVADTYTFVSLDKAFERQIFVRTSGSES